MATMETTKLTAETIFGDPYDKSNANQSQSDDRNGGRSEPLRPVVRRNRMASASLATVASPLSRSRAELPLQGEAAWNDELDVGKSARHSSGSYATGIVRKPAGGNHRSHRSVLHVRQTN